MAKDWNNLSEETMAEIERVSSMMDLTDKGQTRQTKKNCVLAFREDPILKGAFRLNDLTGQKDIVKDLGWKRTGPALVDEDLSEIHYYLELFYGLTAEKNIDHAITIVCNENHYHPIIEYLEKLKWDGKERLRYVLHYFLGAEICDLNYEAMKVFMLGAVERLYHPGCKFEIMLCLVGTQGSGKSSFFRFLALKDEWFLDDLKQLSDENVYRKMMGHWIIEMAEMLGTSSAKSVEEIKAFLSRPKETYKVPYERYPKDRPRQCVFAGTSNTQRFLPLDRSGNRRFFPIPTSDELAEVHILEDEKSSRVYMDQLWAEVMEIYRAGGWSLKLSKEMEHQMNLRRLDHMAEDTTTGMIQAWLDDYKEDHVCTFLIYNECFKELGKPDPKAKAEINSIMNNTIDGWKAGPQHRFNNYGQQRSWVREGINADVNTTKVDADGFKDISDDACVQQTIAEIWPDI